MEVIVIQMDGVICAVVTVPEGKTHEQVFDQRVARDAAKLGMNEEEATDFGKDFSYDHAPVESLDAPTIEDTGASFDDLLDDSDAE
jgi:hypothetical protein